MGRPARWQKREIVNAVLYVAAPGCRWRAFAFSLPALEHCTPLPCDLEPGRNLGENRGPSTSDGLCLTRSPQSSCDSRICVGSPHTHIATLFHTKHPNNPPLVKNQRYSLLVLDVVWLLVDRLLVSA